MSAGQGTAEPHTTDWCAAHGPRPCACWHDGEGQAVDLERLARWARPVEQPPVRPEYL